MADQLRMILPFTPLWKKHVKKVKQPLPEQQISVIVSNVLTPNRQYEALVNLNRKASTRCRSDARNRCDVATAIVGD
jgi:hypothetical protein